MSIEDYEFKYMPNVYIDTDGDLGFEINDVNYWITKGNVIALAKHFKLTAEDINCPRVKELRAELDEADSDNFDEVTVLECKVSELERKLLMKRVS